MFGFCITHILNTECAKIWNKKSVAKRLIWHGSCNQSYLFCFLSYRNFQQYPSNYSLCCFHSHWPTLPSVDILVFFSDIFSSRIYDPTIIWVRQSCKPVGNSKHSPITQLVYPYEIDIPHIKFLCIRLLADSLSLPLGPSGIDQFQSQLCYKPDIQFNCKPPPSQREVINLIVSLPFRRCLSFFIECFDTILLFSPQLQFLTWKSLVL